MTTLLSRAALITTNTATYITNHFPWSFILSPFAYLLAPFISFASILITLTLFTPYRFLSWLLDVIFPLYVFCGIACITGGILGLSGRLISLSIVRAVGEGSTSAQLDEPLKSHDDDDPETVERSAKRRRLGRRQRDGKVKFEPSPWYGIIFFRGYYLTLNNLV